MGAMSSGKRTRQRMRTAGLFVIAICFAGALASRSVRARSMGAFSGRSLDTTPASCYAEDTGAVRGQGGPGGAGGGSGSGCIGNPFPNSPRWEVALPVVSSGTWTVSVGMMGTGTTGPFCQAYAINQVSGIVATSLRLQQTRASYQVVDLTHTPGIVVPGGGYLYIACDTLNSSNSRVGSVNWTTP
jgi:hypothetical protein